MEGFLQRLLDADDPVSRALLAKARVHVVPNMNPDGSRRGHLRTNASGANLNREWLEPTMERSPEVFLVRARMEETGVDLCLDVHGDEELPYNFIAGAEGTPSWNDAAAARMKHYMDALVQASPDFQTKHGYPVPPAGKANMTMASNWVGEAFACRAGDSATGVGQPSVFPKRLRPRPASVPGFPGAKRDRRARRHGCPPHR